MLDEKDKEILKLLQKNCKLKAREISKKLNLPLTTVFAKIKRMEKLGVIKGYKAILNEKKFGLNTTLFVLISYDPASKRKQREIAKEIASIPGVQEVHIIAGEWDILVKLKGKDVESLGKIVLDKLREIKGVEKTMSCIVFETIKESVEIPL